MKIIIDLNAVILSADLTDFTRLNVLTIGGNQNILPWGLYNPDQHKTMEQGLRHWVKQQSDMNLNSVEQLYTFGDSGRFSYGDPDRHIISTGYLASVRPNVNFEQKNNQWSNVYDFFPWEDLREGRPNIINDFILPKLLKWSMSEATEQRIMACFGKDEDVWQEDNCLARYELMYEAGLVFEAIRDADADMTAETYVNSEATKLPTGRYMQYDHRRILATALGRIRANVKNSPAIFDLMPKSFILFDLQKLAEAIYGHNLHKQNFRRYVERENLVIKTNKTRHLPSGRPAKIYMYNPELRGIPNVSGIRSGNSNSIC